MTRRTLRPKFLYKYLTPEKAERLISGFILATPPKYLNDPWEFYIRSNPPDEQTLRSLFEFSEVQAKAAGSPLELPSDYDRKPKEERYRIFHEAVCAEDFRNEEAPYLQNAMSGLFGVISLTEDPLNRVMWTHYAELNKGVVIGFRTKRFETAEGITGAHLELGCAMKIRYSQHPDGLLTLDHANAAHLYTSKHVAWRYEREWRILVQLGFTKPLPDSTKGITFHGVPCSPASVGHVIYGLNTEVSLKKRVEAWLQQDASKELINIETARIDPETHAFVT